MTVFQVLGGLAVLAGVALALPLPLALIVGGVLVLVAGTVGELLVQRRPGAPSDRASGPNKAGGG